MAQGKPRRAAGAANPGVDETPPPIRRQAVVIVHGQGEQRPMGTVRDFVDALWSKNEQLDVKGEKYPRTRAVWIVPDDRSGLYELQRITTPSDIERKTDFFELYYADLFVDTPLRNLLRWMTRLLWRPVRDVDGPIRGPWQALWVLVLLIFALAATAVIFLPDLLRIPAAAVWTGPEVLPGSILLTVGVLWALLPRFVPGLDWKGLAHPALPVSIMAVGLGVLAEAHWGVLALMALLAVSWAVGKFLLPFFGDAASYLSAQTETVSSRQSVRQRGIKLLRALHDDKDYDRIIVIAHSLGTVVAYDLLHILWRDVGPLKDNPPGEASIAALRAVEGAIDAAEATATKTGHWSPEALDAFQAAQWVAFNRLRQEHAAASSSGVDAARQGWKVSDFVTLGSPLTHAALLVTENGDDLKTLMKERVMPTSPPQRFDAEANVLYLDHVEEGGAPRQKKRLVAHHGAVFSVVRWSNLYDPSPAFWLLGDLISGPVSGSVTEKGRFGQGVKDRDVTIRRKGLWPRVFTHNDYWMNPDQSGDTSPEHLKAFREAVDLFRPPA